MTSDSATSAPTTRRAPDGARLLLDPWIVAGALLTLLVAGAIFGAIYRLNVSTDLQLHTAFTQQALVDGNWPGNFLFYVLNAALAGWSDNLQYLHRSSVALLAGTVVARFLLSAWFVRSESQASARASAGLAFALVFVFSLPWPTAYLGQLPATVWHNSTTLMLMPLAVAAFMASLAYIRNREPRMLLIATTASVAAVTVKPTFSVVLGLVLPLWFLAQRRWRPALWAVGAGAVVALAVLAQYVYIYQSGAEAGESSVVVAPFQLWNSFSLSIPKSLAASLAGPAICIIVLRTRLLRYDAFQLGAAIFAVGLAVFTVFAETGPRAGDGNFIWQVYVGMYLVFLTTTAAAAKEWKNLGLVARIGLAVGIGMHVVAGFAYLEFLLSHKTIS